MTRLIIDTENPTAERSFDWWVEELKRTIEKDDTSYHDLDLHGISIENVHNIIDEMAKLGRPAPPPGPPTGYTFIPEGKPIYSSVEMTELLKRLNKLKEKDGRYFGEFLPLLVEIAEKLLICNGAKDV